MQAKTIDDIYDNMQTYFLGQPGTGEFNDLTLPCWQEGGILRAVFMSIASAVYNGWVEMEDVWATIFPTTADREGLRFHGADWDVILDPAKGGEEWRAQILSRIQQPEVGTPPWYAMECKRQFAEVTEAALVIHPLAVNSGYLLIQTRGVTRSGLISAVQAYFDDAERKLAGFDLTVMALDDYLEQREIA